MTSTSEPEDLEKASPSSALEVALGLAVAGAVCGLVALSQSASANAARDQPPLSPAGAALSDGSVASQKPAARQAGTPPEASDSMDLALLLRQRSSTNTLIDEPR